MVPQAEERKIQQQPAPGKQGTEALGTQGVAHGDLRSKTAVRGTGRNAPLWAGHLPATYFPAPRCGFGPRFMWAWREIAKSRKNLHQMVLPAMADQVA